MRKRVALLVGLGAIAGVMWAWRPARVRALVWAGRASVCPMDRALEAEPGVKRRIAIKDRILAASKRVEVDPAGYEAWETPAGRFWIPKGSHFVLPFNLAEQEMEIYTGGEAARLRAGDVVLDCGANVGVFTRRALDKGAAKVIAIEPAPENIECLRRNFREEIEAGRVVLYEKGVWDRDDMLALHVDPHNSAADSFVIDREGSHEAETKIPVTTIDKLVAELGLDRVNFIKMDIEGAEVRAVHGGQATIARFHPRMALSAYHAEDHPVEVPAAARAAWSGYRMECGPCAELRFGFRPDILYFY
ncbi:MAG: FkbM family methyltransferase [Bryobacteraceae bacterium]